MSQSISGKLPNLPLKTMLKKRHVTHVESNGSADVNKLDSGEQNYTKYVQKNTVAAPFSHGIGK